MRRPNPFSAIVLSDLVDVNRGERSQQQQTVEEEDESFEKEEEEESRSKQKSHEPPFSRYPTGISGSNDGKIRSNVTPSPASNFF